jgi:hypothetical protein
VVQSFRLHGAAETSTFQLIYETQGPSC